MEIIKQGVDIEVEKTKKNRNESLDIAFKTQKLCNRLAQGLNYISQPLRCV